MGSLHLWGIALWDVDWILPTLYSISVLTSLLNHGLYQDPPSWRAWLRPIDRAWMVRHEWGMGRSCGRTHACCARLQGLGTARSVAARRTAVPPPHTCFGKLELHTVLSSWRGDVHLGRARSVADLAAGTKRTLPVGGTLRML